MISHQATHISNTLHIIVIAINKFQKMKSSIYALAALLATPSATHAARRRLRRLQSTSSSMSMEMIESNNAAIEPNYNTSSKSSKKGPPKSDISAGRYIICHARSIIELNNQFIPGVEDADNWTLDISIVDDGYEFTGVVTIPDVPCRQFAIPAGDCPASGETILKYYYVSVQSWLPGKKNELTFVSNYATYLKADRSEVSLDTLGSPETSDMNVVVQGKHLFTNDAYYFDLTGSFSFGRTDAIIWAKEEDGCDDE